MKKLVSKLGFNRLYLVNRDGQIVFSLPDLPAKDRDLLSEDNATSKLTQLFQRTERMMSTQARGLPARPGHRGARPLPERPRPA